MSRKYTAIHVHTHNSNESMMECVSKHYQYIDRAKELGLNNIIFTEHGNLIDWAKKKTDMEKAGFKYIHAVEAYMTWTLDEEIRDNHHWVLIAKNTEGFKELNKFISNSYRRGEGGNFYYRSRISWNDLKNTSDNILITTACLGNSLWQYMKSGEVEKIAEVGKWITENRHRVFLEVQSNSHPEQLEYNKMLRNTARNYGIKLVCGLDAHAITPEHDKARKILQRAKGVVFTDEDDFKLHLKGYQESFDEFMTQGIWAENEIHAFMEQTNIIADMCEPIELDMTNKFPELYENPMETFRKRIEEGFKFRRIAQLYPDKIQIYLDRIEEEIEAYEANNAINFMLAKDEVMTHGRNRGIEFGPGRGSVTGSLIAYLMQITKLDPIRWNLNFARFMSKERISLPDIDIDVQIDRRWELQDFLANHPKLTSAPIMTTGTMALKKTIRTMGKGLGMEDNLVDEIAKTVEDNEESLREKYPDLFYYVDIVEGTMESVGQHAAGILVAPRHIDLSESMGLITTTSADRPLTMLSMKQVDAQNYLKFDLLGLKNVSMVANTALNPHIGLAAVEPELMDTEDEAVWKEVIKDNSLIFQLSSPSAARAYNKLFSNETVAKIRKHNPNMGYMELCAFANAILRPSANSYRDDACNGIFHDNGHPALNDFLAPTLGYLTYQEQQIEFLVEFCGYTPGAADTIRRAIGKKIKSVIDNEIPIIREKFIQTMIAKHDMTEQGAIDIVEPFLQIFIDSAEYGFNLNHALAYSFISYQTAWLRYYYPLEFITATLNINLDNEENTARAAAYAKSTGITINPIKFRHARAVYASNKESNSIYQGMEPIKYINEVVAEELYKLKDLQFNTFTDLLLYIYDTEGYFPMTENNKSFMDEYDAQIPKGGNRKRIKRFKFDSRQMGILIGLGFFSEFGNTNKLQQIYAEAKKKIIDSTARFKSSYPNYQHMLTFEKSLENVKEVSLTWLCLHELEFLGRCETVNPIAPDDAFLVTDLKEGTRYAILTLYKFNDGETIKAKMENKIYMDVAPEIKKVIKVDKYSMESKWRKDANNEWYQDGNDLEMWIKIASIY